MENNEQPEKKGLEHYPNRKPDPRPTVDILFGIDEILDTRIATIASHDTEMASSILNSGKYFTRNIDEFKGLTKEAFRKLYDERDAFTLPYSLATNLSFMLERLVRDALIADAAGDDETNEMVFNFNIHGYDLEQEEIDAMVQCIQVFTLGYGTVKVVNYSVADLTPKFIKANFDIIFCYDYQKILETHEKAFTETFCSSVTIICPTLYQGARPDKEGLDLAKAMGKSLFEITRIGLSKFITLRFQPVSLFCISEKMNPQTKEVINQMVSITEEDILKAKERLGDKMVIENPEAITKKPPVEEPSPVPAAPKSSKTTNYISDDDLA